MIQQLLSDQKQWRLIAVAIAAIVLMPLVVLFVSWGTVQTEVWLHLIETQLGRLLGNTLVLLVGVGLGVTLLGVSLAWLTSMCDFPGRKWFDWALMLPFAVPAYVLAFVFIGLLDFSGPVQTQLREWFGRGVWFPEVRSTGGVVLVLVLVFYPYVYMLARSAFVAQGRGLMDSARILGLGPWASFWKVALPMARPAIAAGLALALMETLADFGAVATFNYDTFTTAIYKSWYGFFNLQAAAQLASLLLLFVAVALFIERRARGKARFAEGERRHIRQIYRLQGPVAWLASAYAGSIVLIAFIVPIVQLLVWILSDALEDLDSRYLGLVTKTLTLGAIAAVLTVTTAVLLAYAQRLRRDRWVNGSVSIANLGYALPGSVLAVGIMVAFTWLDAHITIPVQQWLGFEGRQLLMGSLLALVVAYGIRFLAVAFGPVESGLQRIRPSILESAQSLGEPPMGIVRRIYLPMLSPSLITATLLVFVDVLKEMPATLLMRPFGWDTLAVRIFEMTSEGEWERAALPAFTLVLVGLIPVVLLMRRSARH
ncbi:iron ABC transporter permease [Aestuariirhabdus sp. Z084]|uniref:ABC transporter permease n=1 Tax=Aestuariirhabdus haliotis TaxID=2918751 RepID=UPI00201B38AE|nr:iron ABC transporter permease [Aestuariirhabdus haliotis]MCL6416625.1 iron ABC transporter permease [Aestuariirhabdus haliotis]MCL6420660.1 iron ABC transporter permease [Aestuariirhabdus haliotis]